MVNYISHPIKKVVTAYVFYGMNGVLFIVYAKQSSQYN